MPAVRHIRRLDDDGKHLFEAADGFHYISTCVAKPERKYAPATHCLCAELARRLGLPVPRAVALVVDKSLFRGLEDVVDALRNRPKTLPLMAVRSSASPPAFAGGGNAEFPAADASRPAAAKAPRRYTAYRMGSLIFNILTLNLPPNPPLQPATGAERLAFMDQSHCLMDANWNSFLTAGYKEPLTPEWEAAEVRTWASLAPWLRRLDGLDLHPLWEIAFQLPPEWYANDRILITKVLEKLACRCWDVRRTICYLVRLGYFPHLKKEFECMSQSEPAREARQMEAVG